MKKFLFLAVISFCLYACGSDKAPSDPQAVTPPTEPTAATSPTPPTTPDPNIQQKVDELKPKPPNMPDGPVELKGVNLTTPLIQYMVRKGKRVYEEKCVGCHSLDGRALEASTFQGITKNRKPEWIMNLTTGVQMSLADSKREQNKLEKCYTRQPGQRLNIEQSRDLLEYLRSNDGEEWCFDVQMSRCADACLPKW